MSSLQIGAVIMLGGGGESPQEQMVLAAQRASALDLIDILRSQGVQHIVVAAPTTDWLPADLDVIRDDDALEERFHFGKRLADLVERYGMEPVLYFGGGSAPLVDASVSGMIVGLLDRSGQIGASGPMIPSHIVLTNNLHSSDWAAISRVGAALPVIRETNRDNSLAWLLQESGEYDVRVLSGVRPATSMDLDTPSDLALIAHHPQLLPRLRGVLDDNRLDRIPVMAVIDILAREGTTVALLGRVSPLAWQALNKATRCWTRVVGEERGMVASGRVEQGQVQSILNPWLKARGFKGFFEDLSSMADAAIFDSRVLMAAQNVHPDAADRFAADLYWLDAIRDPWLRDFTQAAAEAPIPVILGGHSIVAGGLYVLAEIIQQR
ncbi:MAG TPA: hypothetical protein VKQ72_14395 [Aggregatilineales bacterium]|nr:hypothetical protein [Aggregatilineales bacterium]